jgi:hypothetical protein
MLVGIGIKFLDHHGLQIALSDASEKALFFTFPVTGEGGDTLINAHIELTGILLKQAHQALFREGILDFSGCHTIYYVCRV